MNESTSPSKLKSGFVTLLGLPNAGKSSLLNRVVGEDLAIVTPKAQTTWKTLRGFVSRPELELIITDTPGLQDGTKALNSALSRNAARALKNAAHGREVVAWVLDAAELGRKLKEKKPLGLDHVEAVLVRELGRLPVPVPAIPTFTKADLVRKPEHRAQIVEAVTPLLAKIFRDPQPAAWVSVKSGEGIEDWVRQVTALLPEGEKGALFAEDELSDQTLRGFAAEYIREQCFLQLGEEIPYSIAVELNEFDESDPAIIRIEATIHVEREGQKAVVIGAKGAKIKALGTKAREKIERLVGKKVFLGLRVKITPHWARESQWVTRFGYEDR